MHTSANLTRRKPRLETLSSLQRSRIGTQLMNTPANVPRKKFSQNEKLQLHPRRHQTYSRPLHFQRASGGIGIRAGLRILCRKAWGFESPLAHHLHDKVKIGGKARKASQKDARYPDLAITPLRWDGRDSPTESLSLSHQRFPLTSWASEPQGPTPYKRRSRDRRIVWPLCTSSAARESPLPPAIDSSAAAFD